MINMTDKLLQLLKDRDFDQLFSLLKNDRIFNNLTSDPVFKSVFGTYFIDELLTSFPGDLKYPTFLFHAHKSPDYKYVLQAEEFDKILQHLIIKTGEYKYAKELPDFELSKKIISDYNETITREAELGARNAEKRKDLDLVELYSQDKDLIKKSIFNSEQEKQFYLASLEVFPEYLVLPNVSLTTLFNSRFVLDKYPNYFNYYLKANVDFVIVEKQNFVPLYFFELDSATFHGQEMDTMRDEIKNILITDFGGNLNRITRRLNSQGFNEFRDYLKIFREDNCR